MRLCWSPLSCFCADVRTRSARFVALLLPRDDLPSTLAGLRSCTNIRMSASSCRKRTAYSVSVVIPALNEEQHISHSVSSSIAGGASEVLVVDGYSDDRTEARALGCGARVLHSSRGRSAQCAHGLQHCSSEAVVFLHADTVLPRCFANAVSDALNDFRWGAFSLQLEPKQNLQHFSLRAVEAGVWARCHLFHLPYGDQALFALRNELLEIGGVPQQPLMEDFELVCRLKQRSPPALLNKRARSSSRLWQHLGVAKVRRLHARVLRFSLPSVPRVFLSRCMITFRLQVTAINQALVLGYTMGLPNDTLNVRNTVRVSLLCLDQMR